MEKVKLTQKQADAVEYFRKTFVEERRTYMSNEKLFKAVHVGYEVEEEFGVGDWVKNHHCEVRKIDSVNENGIEVISDSGSIEWIGNLSPEYQHLKHATEEEITKEKERRWWAKHGRYERELKQGDILMAAGRHIFEITADPKSHEFNQFTGNDEFDFSIEEFTRENWKVICFSEDRED